MVLRLPQKDLASKQKKKDVPELDIELGKQLLEPPTCSIACLHQQRLRNFRGAKIILAKVILLGPGRWLSSEVKLWLCTPMTWVCILRTCIKPRDNSVHVSVIPAYACEQLRDRDRIPDQVAWQRYLVSNVVEGEGQNPRFSSDFYLYPSMYTPRPSLARARTHTHFIHTHIPWSPG